MPSSLIGVLQRHCADTDSTCPEPSQLTCLADVLGRIPDLRRVRGRRYRLGSLVALCMVAVLGGATSLAAIARFAADTDSDLREQLGLTSSTPNASTLGRLLARLDGDALDDAVGAWLARYSADPVGEPGDTLVGLAVDGKTVRGSRTDGAAVHLLAAALHACQTVIAQRQIAANTGDSRSNADINTIGRPATARRSSISEPRRPRARPGPVRPIAHTRGVARTAATCRRPPAWTRRDCHTPLPCCEP
ncbi:transposase family protein [Streptomyces sp. NBC_01483]|uniref:transposase family protein n=1 Tax=Streptomyces sp. NBC_01483 TaxID=2903883 RepID=UPI002E34D477|nr:transposase family protein [Streptomyces sp. NBC_01483]